MWFSWGGPERGRGGGDTLNSPTHTAVLMGGGVIGQSTALTPASFPTCTQNQLEDPPLSPFPVCVICTLWLS
jgi:hypothetical protein